MQGGVIEVNSEHVREMQAGVNLDFPDATHQVPGGISATDFERHL
jgi:hypothetical protein